MVRVNRAFPPAYKRYQLFGDYLVSVLYTFLPTVLDEENSIDVAIFTF